jgi:hypothetical protein
MRIFVSCLLDVLGVGGGMEMGEWDVVWKESLLE